MAREGSDKSEKGVACGALTEQPRAMKISAFTADESDTVAAVVEMRNAVNKVDAPFLHLETTRTYTARMVHGWDGEAPETYVARHHGSVVGSLELSVSEWDNTHVAWVDFSVHPDLRRRGFGSALFESAVTRAKELGRRSIGCDGWDIDPVHAFTARHALPRKASAINRRQDLASVDETVLTQLYDEAGSAASAYDLLRIPGRTPEDMLDAVAEMTAAINDAPTDDLDVEDEVYPRERILDYESAQIESGNRVYRVIARHRDTGELAGHSVVAVEIDRPWIGEQHDTSVLRSHRGHRLGLLLKVEMLGWLADVEPALQTIDTWNAESNDHMVKVNEQLGYRPIGRGLQFQREI